MVSCLDSTPAMATRSSSLSLLPKSLPLVSFLSLLLLLHHLSLASTTPLLSHFEGFEDSSSSSSSFIDEDEEEEDQYTPFPTTPPPSLTLSTTADLTLTSNQHCPSDSSQPSDHSHEPSIIEYWDEEEFEGLPAPHPPLEIPTISENATHSDPDGRKEKTSMYGDGVSRSYTVEIACIVFLVAFVVNYFVGKWENEKIAVAWVTKFAVRGSIFDKNFSLVGVGKDEDSPLLLKEGQNVFKFYASGRRFCQGLVATLELERRHDLISRVSDVVLGRKDEVRIEVFMNDDAMDQVVFTLAKRRDAKRLQREERDVQRFGTLVGLQPGSRKWVSEDLVVVSELKEVVGDLITETVVEQV